MGKDSWQVLLHKICPNTLGHFMINSDYPFVKLKPNPLDPLPLCTQGILLEEFTDRVGGEVFFHSNRTLDV